MPTEEDKKETQPKSEAVERPWASNDKLTYDERTQFSRLMNSNDKVVFDERTAHSNRTAIIAEDALQESVNFTKQLHSQFIKREQDANENNRYTLNYLYGLYPEEWLALREMIKQYNESKNE